MRHLLPTQRPSPDPGGHHRVGALGGRGGSQPAEATSAGSFPPAPRRHSGGMGYRPESSRGGGGSSLPDFGPGDLAAFPPSGAAWIVRGVSIAMKSAALALIRLYQTCISPGLPSSCRFYPSCSAYAHEAVEKWGTWRGVGMAFHRLLRCRPFGGHGYDPVP
jgi:putative membrane protein insertion efficiency factor